MARYSALSIAWLWLRATSWGERVAIAIASILTLALLSAFLLQGYLIGDRVGRPGWLCGYMITNGSPFCMRDPDGQMSR